MSNCEEIKSKILNYILSRYELSDEPKVSSSYILPDGRFLVLPKFHSDLFADIEDSLGLPEDDVTLYLFLSGWIRCNLSLGDSSYVHLGASAPTKAQHLAIDALYRKVGYIV